MKLGMGPKAIECEVLKHFGVPALPGVAAGAEFWFYLVSFKKCPCVRKTSVCPNVRVSEFSTLCTGGEQLRPVGPKSSEFT